MEDGDPPTGSCRYALVVWPGAADLARHILANVCFSFLRASFILFLIYIVIIKPRFSGITQESARFAGGADCGNANRSGVCIVDMF